ncbi:MAG: hypothetical protein ACI4EF_00355 [Coprococcus sp.]
MKHFKKLAKISYDFYLPMFIIVLFVMVILGHYDIRSINIHNLISNESAGYNMCHILKGTIIGESYFNFYMLLVITIIITVFRKLFFYDGRKNEFFDTLPFKKNVIVMFDYIMTLSIGLITILVYGIMLSYKQTNINIKIMNKTDAFDLNVLFSINGKLFLLILEICIYFTLYFTICYIGIYLTKNAFAGILFTGLICACLYTIFCYLPSNNICEYYLIPALYFENYNPAAIFPACCVTFLLIIILRFVADYRDNSAGLIFAVKGVKWIALFSAILMIALFSAVLIYEQAVSFGCLPVTVIPLCVIIFICIIHTRRVKSANKWEVK